MTKDKLLKKLNDIYDNCKVFNWDKNGALAISQDTYNHSLRFVSKLEKNEISIDNMTVSPLTDDNMNFCWKYDDGTSFNIDFNRSNDTLMWCCYKDDNHIWDGCCVHFEDIVENLRKFINYHEMKTQ